MSGRHCKILFILSLVVVSLISIRSSAQTETNTNSQKPTITDTTFIEISLSEEGVSAVDANGNDWYFDFELDLFVPGLLDRSTNTEFADEDNIPAEIRCIVETKVNQATTNVIIDFDEYVDNDIIVFGRVTVKGWVKGNITSYNNKVIVKPSGQVDGNITAPEIVIHDGAIVLGEINESSLELTSLPSDLPGDSFQIIMIVMSTLCVFLFLIIALLPKKLEVISDCFNQYKLRSTLLGFLFFLLMPVVIALVAITIVGIVVVPFVPLVYVFAAILGIAAFSHTIGNLVFGRFLSSQNRIYMKSFLGFSLFAIIWILGITFMNDPVNSGVGIFFFVISIIFSIVPVFGGIGASVLTRFGTRSYQSWKAKVAQNPQLFTPAPPPMPRGPEIKTPPRRSDNS